MEAIVTPPPALLPRQLWSFPSIISNTGPVCTPLTLPAGGIFTVNAATTISLTADAVFSPVCTGTDIITGLETAADQNDYASNAPFYASTTPLVYIVAATTVLAWVLFITSLIIPGRVRAPRTDKSPGFFGGRGIISGVAAHQTSSQGGTRPWLQKLAGVVVSIALTIATADTFKVAQSQYSMDYLSASQMRDHVGGSVEIRIMRVVSDIFLWLAQVQTLIRLFPRHKEKLVIKWIGFLLIILDVVFSCLNSFLSSTIIRPRSYQDAIPALSYLFQLALSLLYAAWVFYYAVSKRRYAFYNSKMPNISLVALLSMVAILVPVVFFVADVSQPGVAGWGEYFRWVGSAAGSIVVWEWVDRIELLESEERKEGILGVEVFDGDEMLGRPANDVIYQPGSRSKTSRRVLDRFDRGNSTSLMPDFGGFASRIAHIRPSRANRQRQPPAKQNSEILEKNVSGSDSSRASDDVNDNAPAIVDRNNTASAVSASSTVYAVHYRPVAALGHADAERPDSRITKDTSEGADPPAASVPTSNPMPGKLRTHPTWIAVSNPFKRKRTTPPIEIRNALIPEDPVQTVIVPAQPRQVLTSSAPGTHPSVKFSQARRRSKAHTDLEVREPTVIPAPPRGRTWTPDAFNVSTGVGTLDVSKGTVPSPDVHKRGRAHASFPLNSSSPTDHTSPRNPPDRPLVIPVGSLGYPISPARTGVGRSSDSSSNLRRDENVEDDEQLNQPAPSPSLPSPLSSAGIGGMRTGHRARSSLSHSADGRSNDG